ncbi:MAG: hypothetical protein U0793_11220 [Gemmataceae bacterium]
MNTNSEQVAKGSPSDGFEQLRSRCVDQGFWKGVRASLLVLLLIAVGFGYAVYRNTTNQPATGPIGVPGLPPPLPPATPTGDAPPLPRIEPIKGVVPPPDAVSSPDSTTPAVPLGKVSK